MYNLIKNNKITESCCVLHYLSGKMVGVVWKSGFTGIECVTGDKGLCCSQLSALPINTRHRYWTGKQVSGHIDFQVFVWSMKKNILIIGIWMYRDESCSRNQWTIDVMTSSLSNSSDEMSSGCRSLYNSPFLISGIVR